MISTSTVLSNITSLASDLGVLLIAAVAVVLGGWAALAGLGFAKRKFGKYITGKKF